MTLQVMARPLGAGATGWTGVRNDGSRRMKHAGQATLSSLEALLKELRVLPGLVERRPGIFYVKSKAYLHFHEDRSGVFADAKLDGDDFERFPVNTQHEQASLLRRVAKNRNA
ncbi:MAG TPA: hypothetical protein VHQ87_13510 [Rhizobacter sp.]|jgi:hypothetical protein|nr:hypothetical protein [Rhizobacter sp.]